MLFIGIALIVIGLIVGWAVPHYRAGYGAYGYGPGGILVLIGVILVIWALFTGGL